MQGRCIIAQLGLAAALTLVACSEAQKPDVSSSGGLLLIIPGFPPGSAVPKEYTCRGANRSPGLNWSLAPPGTRSFALVLEDPDAPGGNFGHWGAYDIGAERTRLYEGAGNDPAASFKQVRNDFGAIGYGGPCPPVGKGPHRYHFKLFALDVARLDAGADPRIPDLERAMEGHVLARAEVVAPFARD